MENLFKQCVFDSHLHHKKQGAIIVRTLGQLLQLFSFAVIKQN